MYSLEHLKMFVESAKSGSFSACARKLGKVQSAVSQGIAHLEADMNRQLFDRSTRKPSLTEDGQRLLVYAEAVLRQSQELSSVVQAMDRHEEPLIRLAVDNAMLVPKFSQILKAFGERYPATAIEVLSMPSTDVLDYVIDNKAELGLMFTHESFSEDVELCYIGNMPFYLVCASGHPLSSDDTLKVNDLIPHRQIMLRAASGSMPHQLPHISAEVWWANSFTSIQQMVEHGVGWSYLPGHLVDDAIKQGDLTRLTISIDHKAWSPPVEFITPKNQIKGPALSWLFGAMKEVLD
ncbi:MAG: LysR family transcriptional regulator [Bermanella sp.]